MPEPDDSENLSYPEPIEKTWFSLIEFGVIAATVMGGFLAFTQLVVPARLSGASRSARLKWQQRQTEAAAAVNAHPTPGQTVPLKDDAAPLKPKD